MRKSFLTFAFRLLTLVGRDYKPDSVAPLQRRRSFLCRNDCPLRGDSGFPKSQQPTRRLGGPLVSSGFRLRYFVFCLVLHRARVAELRVTAKLVGLLSDRFNLTRSTPARKLKHSERTAFCCPVSLESSHFQWSPLATALPCGVRTFLTNS